MRIGVKYCGGCNPMFDRTALIGRLKEDFPEAEIVGAKDGGDYAAIVCGCTRACAEHGSINGLQGKTVVTGMDQYDALRRKVGRALENSKQNNVK